MSFGPAFARPAASSNPGTKHIASNARLTTMQFLPFDGRRYKACNPLTTGYDDGRSMEDMHARIRCQRRTGDQSPAPR